MMRQRRIILLHAEGAVAKGLTRELFVRGWDVMESPVLLPGQGIDAVALWHPTTIADIKTVQRQWGDALRACDGTVVVLLDPAADELDIALCDATKVAVLSTAQTIEEIAVCIDRLQAHNHNGAAPIHAVPPHEAIVRLETILDGMKRTAQERHEVYGDSFLTFGKIAAALWPNGLAVGTEEEFARLGVLVQILSKLCRYSATPQGHIDSAHDMAVYSAILELLTEDLAVQ
jgi:hypothetical protein